MGRFDWERKGRGGTWCGILPMVKTKLPVMDSSETWEPTTLILKQSGYQIKDSKSLSLDNLIAEKFRKDLSIKIPSGRSNQFVLTCSNGYSYLLSTDNDVRMRDTLVLTMRMFQRYFWTCRMRDTLVLTMRMFQRRWMKRRKGRAETLLFLV
ncbi:hypothetical protein Vadar_006156 [Vaccinium darrowii]|nr:hypothetical protein Vadar_006156 [Vaccinium darrowii]